MRMEELIYTTTKKTSLSFKHLYLTKSNVIFSEQDQYVIFRLKCSKVGTNHTRMLIMQATVRDSTCSIIALRSLFTHDLQLFYAPLFTFNNSFFTKQHIINSLQASLPAKVVCTFRFSGHNFRKKVIQHVSDNNILDKNIQKLSQ